MNMSLSLNNETNQNLVSSVMGGSILYIRGLGLDQDGLEIKITVCTAECPILRTNHF